MHACTLKQHMSMSPTLVASFVNHHYCLTGPAYTDHVVLPPLPSPLPSPPPSYPNQPLLPSPCSLQDGELLLQKYSKSFPKLTMVGTVACAKGFMRKCIDLFRPAMKEKAKRVCGGGGGGACAQTHAHVHTDTHTRMYRPIQQHL